MKETILIADDDASIVFAFERTFERDGHAVLAASNGREALERIAADHPALVFLDLTMPEMDGLQVLEKIKERGWNLPVIVITGYGTMQTAIRAVQLGAYDYIAKPLDVDKVNLLARRALEMSRLQAQVAELRFKLHQPLQEYELIGNDPQMQEVYKIIGAVTMTPNTTNVIIHGESGTGKELVARAIHQSGKFATAPFLAINCTVLPETLLESELFGHEKGAFTGAFERKQGKFEVAGEGTLFLDEIGDMPAALQQKLLRVVDQRTFERVGGNQALPVHARFICATNKNLEAEIKHGRFREDLLFRLNVVAIKLPPLRERRDDIPLLANYFLAKYNARLGKNVKRICDEVIAAFMHYAFPGNVRELENVIERAMALEKGEVLTLEAFPPQLIARPKQESFDIPILHETLAEARQAVLDAFERKFIVERLNATHGSVTEAAKVAGIERQSFQRLMKKYDVHSEDFRKKA